MQVSLESPTNLERKLKIEVPAEEIDSKYNSRLNEIAKNANLPGFRKGHVPDKVIKMKFGKQLRNEIVADVVRDSLQQALKDQDLNPVAMPNVEPLQFPTGGRDLEFIATFEIYPEINLVELDGLELEELTAEVTDADIDTMLEKMQEQQATWNDVERATKSGDKIEVNIKEAMADEELPEDFVEGVPLILVENPDSSQVIPGLLEALVGKQKDEVIDLKLKFPKNWHDADQVGKQVKYQIVIQQIQEKHVPTIDDDFAKNNFGIAEGGLSALREQIKEKMQETLTKAIATDTKDQLMALLRDKHEVELPKSLIDAEIDSLRKQEEMMRQQGQAVPESSAEELEEIAERRVKLSLVLNEVIKVRNIEAKPDQIDAAINLVTMQFGAEQDKIKQIYYNNQELLGQIRYQVLIDEVTDQLLAAAKKTAKTMSYDEVLELKR